MRNFCCSMLLLFLSLSGCTKTSESRKSAAPSLNPDAPPATSDSADGTPVPTPTSTPEPRYYAYAGGSSNQIGIYRFELPEGKLSLVKYVPVPGAVTSFMAFHPTKPWLYVVNESGTGGVMAFSLNPETGDLTKLNEISANGGGPTAVSIDGGGKFVLTANYGTGEINSYAIQPDGRLGNAIGSTIAGQNAHQIVSAPTGLGVFVPCLGSNFIAQYTINAVTGQLQTQTPVTLSVVTGGPRHLSFHPTKPWAYLVKELNSTLQALSFDASTQQVKLLGTAASTRPDKAPGNNTGAEVQVHPSGSYVYTSNRGDNTIALFTLNADGTPLFKSATATGGSTPRHFSILPNGNWLLIANQDTSSLTTLKVDTETGALTPGNQAITFGGAQFIEAVDLNRYR